MRAVRHLILIAAILTAVRKPPKMDVYARVEEQIGVSSVIVAIFIGAKNFGYYQQNLV